MNMLNTPYYPEITIAGFSFTSTVVRSENVTWSRATGRSKHWRGTCTFSTYVYNDSSTCIPSYSPRYATAQNFPTPKEHERQHLLTISGYIWSGAIISLPLPTLQRQAEEEGMDLIDVTAKLRVLFFKSFWAQGDRCGSLNVEAQCVGLVISQDETLHIRVISRTSEYLRFFCRNPTGRTKQAGLLNERRMTPRKLCLLRR